MKISEFESKVFEVENVRIVIRKDANSKIAKYDYERAANEDWTIAEWLQKRVFPTEDGIEVVVVDGNGLIPAKNTKMKNIRSSYEAE